MRSTERANNEIRQIEILRNYTKHAEGSVLIKCGDTHVITQFQKKQAMAVWF